MLKLTVNGVVATVSETEVLTAGRVGLRIGFTFDSAWDGLFKTAVFQGIETVDVALSGNECTVPHEAMATEGVKLLVGVYGTNSKGTIVIPTVWASFGKIQPSAEPSGNESAEPTQNPVAYAVEMAESAMDGVQRVWDEVDELEGRVTALEQSGGGDYDAAAKAIVDAIAALLIPANNGKALGIVNGAPAAVTIPKEWHGTQAEYDALESYDSNTTYQIVDPTLISIAVTTMPTKQSYTVGETFALTGCVVTATYHDGTKKAVTESCVFSPASGSTLSAAGAQTVSVSHTEYDVTATTSFDVTVNAAEEAAT